MLLSGLNAGVESPATMQALGFCCSGWVVWFLLFVFFNEDFRRP